jgi:hypothetical protein
MVIGQLYLSHLPTTRRAFRVVPPLSLLTVERTASGSYLSACVFMRQLEHNEVSISPISTTSS